MTEGSAGILIDNCKTFLKRYNRRDLVPTAHNESKKSKVKGKT